MGVAQIQSRLKSAQIECMVATKGSVHATLHGYSGPFTAVCQPLPQGKIVRTQVLGEVYPIDLVEVNLLCRELQSRFADGGINFGYFPSCKSVVVSSFLSSDGFETSLNQLGHLIDIIFPLFRLAQAGQRTTNLIDLALCMAKGTG